MKLMSLMYAISLVNRSFGECFAFNHHKSLQIYFFRLKRHETPSLPPPPPPLKKNNNNKKQKKKTTKKKTQQQQQQKKKKREQQQQQHQQQTNKFLKYAESRVNI